MEAEELARPVYGKLSVEGERQEDANARVSASQWEGEGELTMSIGYIQRADAFRLAFFLRTDGEN